MAYDRGLGVTQNHATAAGWYQRAAEQGLTDAQYNLATFYDEGLGTPRDIARGARMVRARGRLPASGGP